jgi:hypothetical protein
MFGMSKGPPPASKRKVKASAAKLAAPDGDPKVAPPKINVTVPLTPAQHAKLQKLGGANWILAQIEKARPDSA